MVSGLRDEPSLDVLAGWLAARIDGPVQRAVGELKVELVRSSETITLRRPQTGVTATLTRTSRPEARIPLARREAKECLAEDLRRLDLAVHRVEALLESVAAEGEDVRFTLRRTVGEWGGSSLYLRRTDAELNWAASAGWGRGAPASAAR